MLRFRRQKPRSILGVDFSSTSIKILELSGSQAQHCVEGYAQTPFPQNLNAIVTSIKTLLSNSNFSSKQAIIAVPDSSVFSKVIQIKSCVDEQDLEEWVLMEAGKYIPYALEDINLDFNVLGPSPNHSEWRDVLVVASRTENVNQRLETMKSAGLEIQIVDVESYAIERAVRLSFPIDQGKNIAFFDMGRLYTRCFVFNGGRFIFSHEDVVGESTLPELLLQQLKRALQFFFSTSHHQSIDQIVLTGNLERFPNIAQFFYENLGISTHITNPFTQMTYATLGIQETIKKAAPQLMVACGLALYGLEIIQ